MESHWEEHQRPSIYWSFSIFLGWMGGYTGVHFYPYPFNCFRDSLECMIYFVITKIFSFYSLK